MEWLLDFPLCEPDELEPEPDELCEPELELEPDELDPEPCDSDELEPEPCESDELEPEPEPCDADELDPEPCESEPDPDELWLLLFFEELWP